MILISPRYDKNDENDENENREKFSILSSRRFGNPGAHLAIMAENGGGSRIVAVKTLKAVLPP